MNNWIFSCLFFFFNYVKLILTNSIFIATTYLSSNFLPNEKWKLFPPLNNGDFPELRFYEYIWSVAPAFLQIKRIVVIHECTSTRAVNIVNGSQEEQVSVVWNLHVRIRICGRIFVPKTDRIMFFHFYEPMKNNTGCP